MQLYATEVQKLVAQLKSFEIKQIPRSGNKKADALSKLASTAFDHLSKEVLVEVLSKRSIEGMEVLDIGQTPITWMTPIKEYLQHGLLPEDQKEARRIRVRAPNYAIRNDQLYRRGFLLPWLKCITSEEGKELLEETHAGDAGAHEGARALTGRTIRMGVYWPSMHQDAKDLTKKCVDCQVYSPIPNLPSAELTSLSSPWPFYQWGIDIVGPFPTAPGKARFLVVAVDYFTKWIEAEPMTRITGRAMINFLWKNILTRFGVPRVLVSDNGTQFAENPFRDWCASHHIHQKFSSVAHPQSNGQTEISNKAIVAGIKRRLHREKGNWVDELQSVLWSYRTTPRTSTQETPFSLTYGTEAMLPPELLVNSTRVSSFKEEESKQDLRQNLDLLEERRIAAGSRQAAYKANVEKYYNKRVKGRAFKVGDLVLRKNEVTEVNSQGKLGVKWEGPYRVIEAHHTGSYILETTDCKPVPRTWNIQNLKKFHY